MIPSKTALWTVTLTSVIALLTESAPGQVASEGERDSSSAVEDTSGAGGETRFVNNELALFQPEPVEAEQPISPVTTPVSFDPFGQLQIDLDAALGNRPAPPPAAVTDAVVGGEQAVVRATRDTGTILSESPSATNVSLFRRPIISQPHIRGYNNRQIDSQLNGGQWLATRFDLDTIVSKIDSGIIEDVIVIKGPYSALYGPSLAFIDVVTAPTLRSCCGVISEFRTVTNWDENGDAWYARQVADVGGTDWGARINFGGRGGVDYRAGNGNLIDADFQSRDIDFAFGYDLPSGARLDFQYLRLDMVDVVLSNQLFDIDALKSDGFTLRYTNDVSTMADEVILETWYNKTEVAASGGAAGVIADTGNPAVGLNAEIFGLQESYQASLGYRAALRYGDPACASTTVGADLRHSKHEIIETDLVDRAPPDPFILNPQLVIADLPDSASLNPGVFIQRQVADCCNRYQIGGRLDYVLTEAGEYLTNFPARDRDFLLYSGFLTGERPLNDVWTGTFAVGHGQRAPSLIELYADAPFMAITQQGLASVRGDTNLQSERATQVDVGIQGDFCRARVGWRGFFSYVENYITYDFQGAFLPAVQPAPPTNFFAIHNYVNSDSYFAGTELNADLDIGAGMTLFGNLAYTYGEDVGRFREPVYGIYPFDSRVGIRLQRGDQCHGFGIEFSGRFVAEQDRFARLRQELPTDGFATGDLRGYVRLSPGLLLTAGVTNIADRLILEHFDYRALNGGIATPGRTVDDTFQPGRNFYVGAEATF